MAEPIAKGSIVYKLIILVLIIVVLAAIIIPQKEWERQAAEQELCRHNLENVYFTSLQYLKQYKTYQADLDTLIEFIKSDSMMVPGGLFEVERLTVWESPRDSFLVGFPDGYHYTRIDWEYASPESLYLKLVPKDRFNLVPESKMSFVSDDSVFVEYRAKGEHDTWITIWGKSLIEYERIKADSAYIPTQYFAVSEDPDVYKECPASHEPYDLIVNANVKIRGEITYEVLREEGGNVNDNEFLSNLFIKKLRSDAAVEALNMFKSDTTIFVTKENEAKVILFGDIPADTVVVSIADSMKIAALRDSIITALKDSLVISNFNRNFNALKPRSRIVLEEEAIKMVVVDSISTWDDSLRIKDTLFSAELNAEESTLAASVDIASMLTRLNAVEKYHIAKVDSVGITISCPIEGEYSDPDRSFFIKLFGVGPAKKHGKIKNGDYSWSEKK